MPETITTEKLAGQPVGRRLKITGFALPADVQQRLLEMGLTAGTECTVMRYAPLGDPLEIKVRGYCLSLRLHEAEGVQVQPIN
jgi:Fe2+ transport system protein FeoA